MERINLGAIVVAMSLIFLLGCAADQERPSPPEPKVSAKERGSIDFLKSKGARFQWGYAKPNPKPDELDDIYWTVSLQGDAKVSDSHLEHLKVIKNLKVLRMTSPNVTDQGLAILGVLDQLEYLTLTSPTISDHGINKLAEIRTLKELTLGGMKLSAKAFERFGQLDKLRHLKFEQTIPEDGLSGLRTLKALEELDLSETNVADIDLKALKALEKLERLFLTKTKVSDAGMAELIDLPFLKTLFLNNTAVGNAGLKHLCRSKSLTGLRLGDTKVDDDGLPHIADSQSLTNLTLGTERISDAGLRHLGKSRLTVLRLDFGVNHKITNSGIESLQEIKTLKLIHSINITLTKATDDGLRRLQEARPDLEIRVKR
jgi:hypothetical protein